MDVLDVVVSILVWSWALVCSIQHVLFVLLCFVFLAWAVVHILKRLFRSVPTPTLATPNSRTVLVTGGSRGIGFALARLFVLDGYETILLARGEAKLLEAKEALLKLCPNIRIHILPVDLSHVDAATSIVRWLEERNLQVDILVNNAGLGHFDKFVSAGVEIPSKLIKVNVISLVELTRVLLPSMIQRGYGRLLFVSGLLGHLPMSGFSIYSACKAFLNSFTTSLRYELKQDGHLGKTILMSVLCPPKTDTNFGPTALRLKSDQQAPKTSAGSMAMMSPEDVASQGYSGMWRNEATVFPSMAAFLMCRLMPTSLFLWLTENEMRKN